MRLDDFDAVFRSAVKDRFRLEPPVIGSVLLVTDMLPGDAADLETTVKQLLAQVLPDDARWRTVGQDELTDIDELLALIDEVAPDLIVCYRHLLGRTKELRHSLGSVVDTLTQVARPPVLLLPPPTRANFDHLVAGLDRVLVVTDHLSGDDRLVNWGVAICAENGSLFLAHIEDQNTFDRYSEMVGMIPDIDTDTTVDRLKEKLLGRPRDYIASIAEVLEEASIAERVVPIVGMARGLGDYKQLFDEHEIQLVVMNTKDENQLAMHGMAYAVAVEVQDRPLLLL